MSKDGWQFNRDIYGLRYFHLVQRSTSANLKLHVPILKFKLFLNLRASLLTLRHLVKTVTHSTIQLTRDALRIF